MTSPHQIHLLAGGAKLVTVAMPERLSSSVVLMFGGGSRREDDRLAGVSHFIEHLYFKGTQKRPSSKEIANAIEGVGGFINASTDKELTAYWVRVPSVHTDLGLDVLFDLVSNSKVDPADIERERAVILEELKGYQDQPQDHVVNLFEELMWPGHPLGRDIAGTLESVSRLTRDEILARLGPLAGPTMAILRARRAATTTSTTDTRSGNRDRPGRNSAHAIVSAIGYSAIDENTTGATSELNTPPATPPTAIQR